MEDDGDVEIGGREGARKLDTFNVDGEGGSSNMLSIKEEKSCKALDCC